MARQLTRNEKAAILGIVGGVLMLVAGTSGAATWESIGEWVRTQFESDVIDLIFQILVVLGALGGLVVILGGALLRKRDTVRSGKLLITIGAGFGLIGLMIFIAMAVLDEDPGATLLGALGVDFVGLVLSIAARTRAQA
jgi:hypothetical protein